MADKHPYVQSPGHLSQVINQFRKSFPTPVSADTLKKLGFAPKNESYVVNTLRFLGFLDDEGNRTDLASKVFSLHQNDQFQQSLGNVVKTSYEDLFKLHAESAWKLDADGLITFFRQADQSSAVVGRRQANTFLALSGLAGCSELPESKKTEKGGDRKKTGKAIRKSVPSINNSHTTTPSEPRLLNEKPDRAFGLTVRIEVRAPNKMNL
jgi:hypothetical protein